MACSEIHQFFDGKLPTKTSIFENGRGLGQHLTHQNGLAGSSSGSSYIFQQTLSSPNNICVENTKLWNQSLEIHIWIHMTTIYYIHISKSIDSFQGKKSRLGPRRFPPIPWDSKTLPACRKLDHAWVEGASQGMVESAEMGTAQSLGIFRKTIWLVDLPLWKMMDFVSWDDEIPNWMEKNMFQTTNQKMIYILKFRIPKCQDSADSISVFSQHRDRKRSTPRWTPQRGARGAASDSHRPDSSPHHAPDRRGTLGSNLTSEEPMQGRGYIYII
jgi:hypothetical protein